MRIIHIAVAVWLVGAGAGLANDGFGGLTATGLTFGQTEAIAMVEEDLFIGLDSIRVDYLFRNITGQDVAGEVIFPLPPIPLGQLMTSDWNLPEDRDRDNLLGFSVLVDGQPQRFAIDRIAVIEPPWQEGRAPSETYDTPGRDVTALLVAQGIPLSLDVDRVVAQLAALPPEARDTLAAAGLIEVYAPGDAPAEYFPNWSVVLRYHWHQKFPAGKDLRIQHRYENRAGGGIFVWRAPPVDDWSQALQTRYCIDKGTSAAIVKRLKDSRFDGEDYVTGLAWNIAYVLRTANSWAGPIGRFRLTLDKGSTANVISVCADGLRKTGPTTFEMQRQDFRPDRDLEVLIVRPLGD